jgi:hypothetical protein
MSKPQRNSKKGYKPRRSTKGANENKTASSDTIWKDQKDAASNSTGNPFELYSKNAALIENATKINTNNPLGVKVNLFNNTDYKALVDDGVVATNHSRWDIVPGVGVFEFVAGPGPSRDPNSAVNIAANSLYAYIRHANSGAANYDSTSLMMLMLAMDNAYMWYFLLIRLYGTLSLYSAENRYYPRCLVAAQGFDFESCKAQMNNLQFQINRFGKILNSLYIPRFKIFDRHRWCCENYFLDDNSTKAQTYLLKPAGLHFLNEEVDADHAFGNLIYVPWSQLNYGSTSELTYDDILGVIDRFAEILQYSSDVAMISGDIKKAYGAENCMSVPSITMDFDKLPVKDDVVLSMIHNMFILDYSNVQNSDLDIIQKLNPGNAFFYVTWDPMAHYAGRFDDTPPGKFRRALSNGKRLLNYYNDDPSPEEIVESTRFTAISNSGIEWAHGTEIIINQRIYWNRSSDGMPTFQSFKQISGNTSDLPGTMNFNSYPIQIRYSYNNTTNQVVSHAICAELENYTVVNHDQLSKLHEAAVLSEWDVPSIQNYV